MAKIKICGITTEEEVGFLNEAGVDYAGFVQFYPKSKRNISTDQAVRLMERLAPSVQKVAVMVSPKREQLRTIAQTGFDIVQIHGELSDDLLADMSLPVWKAFNVKDLTEFERFRDSDAIAGFVFDAQIPGSGKAFDWSMLQELPGTGKLRMLAGGLDPSNVAEALQITGVDGVDTSSGVEKESGRGKDRDKIQAFVRAVRGTGEGSAGRRGDR